MGEWWLVPVLATIVVGTVLRGPNEPDDSPASWAGILCAAAVLALLLRWRRPQATVVLHALAAGICFGIGFPHGSINLSALLSAYALTRLRPSRWVVDSLSYESRITGI